MHQLSKLEASEFCHHPQSTMVPENMKLQERDLILEFNVLNGTIRKGESIFH